MDFLETDTILFHCVEPPELLELQAQKWNPVLLWFRERYIAIVIALLQPCTGEMALFIQKDAVLIP